MKSFRAFLKEGGEDGKPTVFIIKYQKLLAKYGVEQESELDAERMQAFQGELQKLTQDPESFDFA